MASNRMRPIRRVQVQGEDGGGGGQEADPFAEEFDALSNKLESGSVYEDEEAEEVEELQAGTHKDSEHALNEYGDDYHEYMQKFQRLHGPEEDEQSVHD